jgi:hypothetical protein
MMATSFDIIAFDAVSRPSGIALMLTGEMRSGRDEGVRGAARTKSPG